MSARWVHYAWDVGMLGVGDSRGGPPRGIWGMAGSGYSASPAFSWRGGLGPSDISRQSWYRMFRPPRVLVSALSAELGLSLLCRPSGLDR